MGCTSSRDSDWDNSKNWHPIDDRYRKDDKQRKGENGTVVPPIPDKTPLESFSYVESDIGTFELYRDYRSHPSSVDNNTKPNMLSGDFYIDTQFPLHVVIEEFEKDRLASKRPKEFSSQPVLFSDGTTRFDVRQGKPGTCWFLSMLANISENKVLFNRVITNDSYNINSGEYDGVFHCKFWRFGEWHDVYIDDFLPIQDDYYLWGARSASDPNEMWVSLLEKAFARLYGSYNDVYGGQPGNAYIALTGGVCERISFSDNKIQPQRLFQRVRNAIASDSLVSCAVPEKNNNVKGLVGGHAYSLNATNMVETATGDRIMLVRVRNPWGRVEWTGDWSDKSVKWGELVPNSLTPKDKDDGEFWISMDDLLRYFFQLTICSLTPDIDLDGKTDNLKHVTCIYGEWMGDTAAGQQNKTRNPVFTFTLSNVGLRPDGRVPVVIQLIQKIDDRKTDRFYIKCFLYRVRGGEAYQVEAENEELFSSELQITQRYHLKPRQFVILPSTYNPGEETEFLIRIFTTSPLQNVGRHI